VENSARKSQSEKAYVTATQELDFPFNPSLARNFSSNRGSFLMRPIQKWKCHGAGAGWLLASALLVACVLTAQMALGRKKEKSGAMDGQKRALHALNRLTFGPRPGDVDRVRRWASIGD